MNRKSLALPLIIGASILAMIIISLDLRLPVVREVSGLALIFILPGLALALHLRSISGVFERITFSIGMSLVITMLSAFVLNLTPGGLRGDHWAIFLGTITLVLTTGTLVRGRTQPTGQPISGKPPTAHLRQFVVLMLAALITTGALSLARTSALQQHGPGFTQLWLLPSGDASPSTVRLGIQSNEHTVVAYRLQLGYAEQSIQNWPEIRLTPGERWETTISLPVQASDTRLEARLYKLHVPNVVYRQTWLWLK